MKFETERSEGVCCGNIACNWYDEEFDQFCSSEYNTGDPGPAFCPEYAPGANGKEKAQGE